MCSWTRRLSRASRRGQAQVIFKADSETDLREIYENLSTQLVFEAEQTELTALFTGLAAVLLLVAGALSLLWFNRLP